MTKEEYQAQLKVYEVLKVFQGEIIQEFSINEAIRLCEQNIKKAKSIKNLQLSIFSLL